MTPTILAVSLDAAGLIDVEARQRRTHMSVRTYLAAGGPFKAHYQAWLQGVRSGETKLDPRAVAAVN